MNKHHNTFVSQKKGLLVLIAFFFSATQLWAQSKGIPDGYYSSADGLSGSQLKTALYNIIKGHTSVSYDALWTYFQTTDKKANGKVWDMYSDGAGYEFTFGTQQCGNYSGEGDCYNREHSFPKSWFNDATPMYTDMFHLYPTDGYVNGRRSNYPFGEVGSPTWTALNGSKLGPSSFPGYSGIVFEPIDEYKGDFARAYFYMVTRYENVITNWPGCDMLDGTSYPAFTEWAKTMLIEWSIADPTSQKELDRNEAVYGIQHNRNPFIDHPEYVSQVWGGNAPSVFSTITLTPLIPSSTDPVNVSADITDADGISTATLQWGTSSTAFDHDITMNLISGNQYASAAAIPSQSDGITVIFRIVVVDQLTVSSNSATQSYTIGGGSSGSPVTIFEDNFEDGTLNKWNAVSVSGSQVWVIDATHGVSSSNCAKISGYETASHANEDWLISPAIDLNGITDASLSFYSACNYTGNDLEVTYSTNYSGSGDPNLSTWTSFTGLTLSTGSWSWTSSGTIDLTSLQGSTIYIGFKYTSTDTESKTWELDEVSVTGTSSTIDNTAPVLTYSPVNQSTGVAISSPIIISSNELLKTNTGGTIDPTYLESIITFKTPDAVGTDVPFTASINANSDQITITPQALLQYATTYYLGVMANSLEDEAGNEIQTVQSITFSTLPEADVTVPVLTFNPVNQSTGVAISSPIIISSNELLKTNTGGTIDPTYLESIITFKTPDAVGTDVPFSASINANSDQITITPQALLQYATTYYLDVTANSLEDEAGNSVSTENKISFTTQPQPDTDEPQYLYAALSSTFDTITLYFNEPIINNLVDAGALKQRVLFSSDGTTFNPLSADDLVELSDEKLIVKFLVKLENPFNKIKVQAETLKDTAGNALMTEIITETLDATGSDTQAPHFISGYPTANSIESNGFTMLVKLNEPGRIYYKLQLKSQSAPSVNQVKTSDTLDIPVAGTEYSHVFSGLLDNTNYAVFLLPEDDNFNPNAALFLSKILATTLGVAPSILIQPQDLMTCAGEPGTLSIKAQGTEPLVYSWKRNGVALDNTQNDTLFFEAINSLNEGTYTCQVSNEFGTITSNQVTLTSIALVNAGTDGSISVMDTLTKLDLFSVLGGEYDSGGKWEDLNQSLSLTGNLMNPQSAGSGVFTFRYLVESECNSDSADVIVTVEHYLSVPETRDFSLTIFPNPGNGIVEVLVPDAAEGILQVISTEGRAIVHQKIHKGQARITLDLSSFNKGLYLIRILGEKNWESSYVYH